MNNQNQHKTFDNKNSFFSERSFIINPLIISKSTAINELRPDAIVLRNKNFLYVMTKIILSLETYLKAAENKQAKKRPGIPKVVFKVSITKSGYN